MLAGAILGTLASNVYGAVVFSQARRDLQRQTDAVVTLTNATLKLVELMTQGSIDHAK